MKRQSVFTLIELVIVIVILGALAVIAAPRFIDIETDARIATLKTGASALNSAAALVHEKSVMQGISSLDVATASLDSNGRIIEVVYGYPSRRAYQGIALAMDDTFNDQWGYTTFSLSHWRGAPADIASHSGPSTDNATLNMQSAMLITLSLLELV